MWITALIALLVGGVIGIALGTVRLREPATIDVLDNDLVGRPPSTAQLTAVPSVDDVGGTLRAAVDQLALGIIVGDAEGRVLYRNLAAMALQGTHAG